MAEVQPCVESQIRLWPPTGGSGRDTTEPSPMGGMGPVGVREGVLREGLVGVRVEVEVLEGLPLVVIAGTVWAELAIGASTSPAAPMADESTPQNVALDASLDASTPEDVSLALTPPDMSLDASTPPATRSTASLTTTLCCWARQPSAPPAGEAATVSADSTRRR
jgi:hypothetical protein